MCDYPTSKHIAFYNQNQAIIVQITKIVYSFVVDWLSWTGVFFRPILPNCWTSVANRTRLATGSEVDIDTLIVLIESDYNTITAPIKPTKGCNRHGHNPLI